MLKWHFNNPLCLNNPKWFIGYTSFCHSKTTHVHARMLELFSRQNRQFSRQHHHFSWQTRQFLLPGPQTPKAAEVSRSFFPGDVLARAGDWPLHGRCGANTKNGEGMGRYPKITIFMGQIEIVAANMGMYCHSGFRWAHVFFRDPGQLVSVFFHFNLHWKLTSTSNVLLLGGTKIAYPKVQWFSFFSVIFHHVCSNPPNAKETNGNSINIMS